MTERLIYTNERGESVEFSTRSLYHVNIPKDVMGLGDISAVIFSINGIGQDGATYLGSRIESRDIEIFGYIKERNKEKAHELKRRLNTVLNPHLKAKLMYQLGKFKRVINCHVEFAPKYRRESIFEEFTLQLNCLNPFWMDEHNSVARVSELVPMWEFPWEIPSAGFEFAQIRPMLNADIVNLGDVRTGMFIELTAVGNVTNPYLTNLDTYEFIKFNINMRAGDVLSISTFFGDKKVTLRRGVETANAISYLDADSTFLELNPGLNLLMFNADSGNALNALRIRILYNNYYLGV